MKTLLAVSLLALAGSLVSASASAEVDWNTDPLEGLQAPRPERRDAPPSPPDAPPPPGVVSVVMGAPRSADLPHRDRREGGHLDVSLVDDVLGVAYTFCSDVACLDHKQFTFPSLTRDAAGRRFLSGRRVVAVYDAKGAVTLAAGVKAAVSVVAEMNGDTPVDVVSVFLELAQTK